MKINIEYASFFNRNSLSFVDKKVIDTCNNFIYRRSGIYVIINKINGYKYVGKSKNITSRLEHHKSLLRNNHHIYRTGELSLLQKAWNKYGEDAFEFKILEFCEVEKLNEREKYWIDYYKCNHSKYQQGYNMTDGGEGACFNQNIKGRIQINNGKIQKMIYPDEFPVYEKQGFVKGILPQTIERVNKNRKPKRGEEHWAYGKHFSEETKKKMSNSHNGKSAVWNIGRTLSEEHKRKISESKKGTKIPKETIEKVSKSRQKPIEQYNKENIFLNEFNDGVEAENVTGIHRSHISQCCNGKRKTAGGYIWRFKNE